VNAVMNLRALNAILTSVLVTPEDDSLGSKRESKINVA
jgi:hypothetical protein